MTPISKAADLALFALDRVRNRLFRYGSTGFLDAHQTELGGVEPLSVGAVVLAAALTNPNFTFVSIGAFDGSANDQVADVVRAFGFRGVFVEPQSAPFDALRRNFAEHRGVRFERAAIAAQDGTAPFYRVDPEFWRRNGFPEGTAGQISSLNRAQIRKHVEHFGNRALAEREAEYLIVEEIPTISLSNLLAKYGIERPNLVQIDTEGFDYEVLKMIDWRRSPDLIHFETVHLSIADRMAAWALLRKNGYRLFASDLFNTLAIRTRQN